MNLAMAKGIFPALKMYAGDHGGRYPITLQELEPDYLANFETIRYRAPEAGRRYDWFYIQGLREDSPAHWIVLASPTDQTGTDPAHRGRIAVYNDGRGRWRSASTAPSVPP